MTELVIASTQADAEAATAIENHHAELAGALALHVERIVHSASTGARAAAERSRDDLVAWCRAELVPHALAEEATLYPAAAEREAAGLLVDGMLGEHRVILDLVDCLAVAADPVRAAGHATALEAVFNTHLTKENELIVPLLVSDPEVCLADLLGAMHEELTGAEAAGRSTEAGGCGGHSCSCGEVDAPGSPELDARVIPHAIRHATIFGALDTVPSGGGLVLVAPHDPLPLLAQIEQRWPGVFHTTYLERGPEDWRLEFIRN